MAVSQRSRGRNHALIKEIGGSGSVAQAGSAAGRYGYGNLIERTDTMTDATANSTSILRLVNKTMELPTIPEVLVKLNEVIASEDSSAEDVA